MKKTIFTLFVCLMFVNAYTQLSINGTPKSFSYKTHSVVPTVYLAEPDMSKVEAEDAKADAMGKAYRVGVFLNTSINPQNSGVWDFLPDGSAIWRVSVKSDGAKAIGLYFSDWFMTPGIEVYAYSPDKEYVIGAFTELNNNFEFRTMAIDKIPGEEAILEVFVPDRNQNFDLELNRISYFYRGAVINNPKVGACQVNVACSEADNWRNEVRSVAKINMVLDDGTYMCSGFLVNNINKDCKPYFLTADHCSASQSNVPVTPTQLSQWTFTFNYQSNGCKGTYSTSHKSYIGATYKASDSYGETSSGSDFFLCLLNNTPEASVNAYYAGWSYLSTASTNGVSIHHPDGAIKKISTYTKTLLNYTTHWGVYWAETANGHGVTEGGSSGSPIFDKNNRAVGTLTGGSSTCENPNKMDVYGKMSVHWASAGTSSDKQLKYWLDPTGASGGTLDGRDNCFVGLNDVDYVRANIQIFPNPASEVLNIDFSKYNVENGVLSISNLLGKTVVESGMGNYTDVVKININDLTPGMYFVKISSNTENVSIPFIVQ